MKENRRIIANFASALLTVALGLTLWFGLDALSSLMGRQVAEATSLLVFIAAGGGLLWNVISGK